MKRLLTALLLGASVCAHGLDAGDDPGFGDGGWALTGWDPPGGVATDTLRAMAVQADGRIVLAGTVFVLPPGGLGGIDGCGLTRLHPDGSLDTSFGDNGRVLLNFPSLIPPGSATPSNVCFAESLTVDSAGRIVLAARQAMQWFDASNQFQQLPIHVGVARLLSNGTPDTSFAFDGRMHFSFAAEDRNGVVSDSVTVLALPDGKLFLAMTVTPSRGSSGLFDGERVGTARVHGNGTLDTSYFSNGKRLLANGLVGSPAWGARHATLDSQGRVLLTGHLTGNLNAPLAMWVGRLLANGSTDGSFGAGTNWWQSVGGVSSPPQAEPYAVTLDQQQRVLIAGASLVGTDAFHTIVARLSPDGIPESSFGTNGRVLVTFQYGLHPVYSAARAIKVDAQGRIVLASQIGRPLANDQFEYLLGTARLHSDGSLDTSYWNGGRRVIDGAFQAVGSRRDFLARAGLALTDSGRVLLASTVRLGTVNSQIDDDFAVLALRGAPTADQIFANGFEVFP